MYRAATYIDTDVLDVVAAAAVESPIKMRRAAGVIARGPTVQAMIAELSREPGPPVYRSVGVKGQATLRWKSAKQRRAFYASKAFGAGIPFARGHQMSQAWRGVLGSLSDGGGVFLMENNNRATPFMQGDFAQPYALDTGWPQAAPIISRYSEPLQDELIDGWFKVVGV